MKFLQLVLVVASFYLAVNAEDVEDPDVLVLTTDNFDSTIAEHEFILVEFYAPWCGHCKRLAPEYAKAATELKGKVALAKVDATVESDLASKYGVRGYPTLKWFRSGEASEYSGGRTADDIVAWASKKSGPPSTELDAGDVDSWVEKKLAVVGTFTKRGNDAHAAFIDVAKDGALDDFVFADVEGDKDGVTLYTLHAEPQQFDMSGGDLKEFILANGYPLVDELPGAWERYSKKGNPLAIIFVDPAADNKELLATATEAAEKVSSKFSFSFADGVRFKQQIERMGAPTESLPVIAAMKLSGKANFPYDGEVTADALAAWAEGIADGSIKAKLKSEEIPESNDGPVTVVVGKNFNDVVLGDKNVLLEIYAPWCGHCKSLAPIYEKLGEHFADRDDVVIAKLDGTANDLEDVEYRGFPTLKWFPAGKGIDGMVDYEGGRTLEELQAFVDQHAPADAAAEHTEL